MTKDTIYKSESGKKQIQDLYDRLLENWPKTSRKYHIETKYGNTFIIESGDHLKPALILLHGSGSNSAMWTGDVTKLSKHYHVFAIDIIGECGKSNENRPDFKGNSYSEWLLEIINILKIKKASLIGCSLGGWIALDFSIRYPAIVDKLVLIATAGITQIRTSTIFLVLMTSITGNWGFRKLNKKVYGDLKIDKTVLEFTSLVKKYFKPRTDVLPVFTTEQLGYIKAQTLFIGGENDCFYNSKKTALRLSNTIIASTSLVLKNTGHVITGQTERIVNFLSNTDGK